MTGSGMNMEMAEDSKKSRIKAQIDENLRRVYEEALSEEVPDRFRALLDQLRQKELGK